MIANEPANTAWSYGRTLEINKNASWLGKEVYIKAFRLPEMKNWSKNETLFAVKTVNAKQYLQLSFQSCIQTLSTVLQGRQNTTSLIPLYWLR